ncbi:MAG TPA: type II secretion system protein GspK [Gemmatimonadaceae bacterium]|jgi:type II secretory pathway component PulK|nr:type II secretion system protein GspK [Gemmatimonadaceae bacterium]
MSVRSHGESPHPSRAARPRRGVALLAALWLVVAIATVALQFSLEAHERRAVGILISDRGIQRAAAVGALALVQAKLDYALRVAPTATTAARLQSFDPWLDVDSTYTGTIDVDSTEVQVQAHDLGEQLNINQLTENDFQTFFSYLLKDYEKSTQLAQSIMDWRDADSIPRPNGAERDAYIKAGMLGLPTNAPFREVEELRDVYGMTPDIYALVSPYFTTRGTGFVNLNTAPAPVLRTLPGMTDAILNTVLQMRSQGRRISNVNDVLPPVSRSTTANALRTREQAQLNTRATVETDIVELVIIARTGPQSQPTRLVADIRRSRGETAVSYKAW